MITTDTAQHFDAAEFDAALEEHGTEVLWRKARTCPCMGERTGQPEIDCPHCDEGILWDDGELIIVLAPGRQRRDEYDQAGMWMQGMLTITFPSTLTPGHLDRIEFQNAVMVVNSERLVRGRVDKLGRSKERVRFRHALSVEYCESIEGNDLRQWQTPLDYEVNERGDVSWAAGRGPANGSVYTMRYMARPTYLAWSPQSRDEGQAKMPYRCMAQRLDFFARASVGGAD